MPESALVYLVGAGPGDPGLLTLRGKECLARAQVVVYDFLVHPDLLNFAPASAERIYVGKQADRHALEQTEINALLVAKAREGKIVVRLKGGDPFVFGRGGEEAEVLAQAGIPFEIVPGVTAGIAAPAYAGIPVTHRDHNSVLTFITGHEDPDKTESAVDYRALAAGGGALVFYMGVKNLSRIATQLIEAGRPADTPVALIRWGTLPDQRVVEGTLADIADRADAEGLTPPCVIVVGSVVSLRRTLNWFEARPLFGKTVLVTRSREQAGQLAAQLAEGGARVLQFHTIRFEPPADDRPLRDAIDHLDRFDWIVFTSTNGVDRFFALLRERHRDARALAGRKIAVIGPGTGDRLAAFGLTPDLVPEAFTSQGLYEALRRTGQISGRRFLLPRADIAGTDLPQKLHADGADVTDVQAYRTVPGELTDPIREAIQSERIDVAAFTSSSTVRNFAALVRAGLGRLPDRLVCVSIGPETSKALRDEGLAVAAEVNPHTIDAIVHLITERFGRHRP